MKKTLWTAAMLLGVVAIAALAQESSTAVQKTKPSAARIAGEPTPASTNASAPIEAPSTPEAAPSEGATLPVGTTVRMKLETMLSTTTTKPNSDFAGRVTEDVKLGGRTIIPVGASLTGHVTRSEEPRRVKGTPVIDLRPESITMPNGDVYAINAVVVDTSDPKNHHVDEEGQIKGSGHDSIDYRDAAIGLGAGTVTGALIHGADGALIGAGIGGGAAFVRWMSRRHSETIPAGTELFLELSRPMTLSMSGANGK